MKKIFLLLSVLLISCSRDSSDNGDSGRAPRLLQLRQEGNGLFLLNFLYLGETNDCNSILDHNHSRYYSYRYDANNKLTDRFAFNREYSYQYSGDQISVEVESIGNNLQGKKMFYYNPDGTLSKLEYYSFDNPQYRLVQY